MGRVGLEPTTNALKGRCSTIELPTRWMDPDFADSPQKFNHGIPAGEGAGIIHKFPQGATET